VIKFKVILGIIIISTYSNNLQASDTLIYSKVNKMYDKAFSSLGAMLNGNQSQSFKRAVFITENVFLENSLDSVAFNTKIAELSTLINAWMKSNPLTNYRFSDSLNFLKNFGIYKMMKDSIKIATSNNDTAYSTIPYTYDFADFEGEKDWTKMFVLKLLYTYSGNCHSLPYLYKILANELGATCWLALAPNHMYISNRCKKIGWYNTELTSGDFPIDAWIMASGYLPLKAVQTGIYMDTLSNKQSIALCVLDMAKGYEHKTKNYFDGFIIKCCDLSLQYFPLNVQAILLKAETLKKVYEKQVKDKNKQAQETYHRMEELYAKLFDLGYREMPEKMYMQWLQSVVKERDKYTNRAVKEAVQGPSK
jgi:hypothetical protein